jgi:hypothetical protein
MRIFVLTAAYELRVSRKSHLRDHPTGTQKEDGLLSIQSSLTFSITSRESDDFEV